jgi:hypothetical protein
MARIDVAEIHLGGTTVITGAEFAALRKTTCKDRSPDQLANGIQLLGKRALRATELSWLLTNRGEEVPQGTRAREAVTAAMLTWERSLVEFLLAPVRRSPGGYKLTLPQDFLRQNICPWCFDIDWRLEDDDPDLHELMNDRWKSISRHLAHASWQEAKSPRSFNVEKIANVVAGLERFRDALIRDGGPGRKELADSLASALIQAKHAGDGALPDRTATTI